MSTISKTDYCISCNKKISPKEIGQVRFNCPSCNAHIVRCSKCRNLANTYSCVACDFQGP